MMMVVMMNDSNLSSMSQLKNFLSESEGIEFNRKNRKEVYSWIEETLIRFQYAILSKKEKGLIRKYLMKITGYSKAQLGRHITQYRNTGQVRIKEYERHKFQKKYTSQDIRLLAKTAELLSSPNGVAKGKGKAIGVRCKPQPEGKPGYIRVDSIHQGDQERQKGAYHINTIDELTQWEVIAATEKITEEYLLPLLEKTIASYPYRIINFHCDNGSEYINQKVAEMLNRLLIKLTKSRPRHTNDNALVETKNGWVVRKWLGYSHIRKEHAQGINDFYFQCFNEYLNFHRPCAFPTEVIDKKGKIKKKYR